MYQEGKAPCPACQLLSGHAREEHGIYINVPLVHMLWDVRILMWAIYIMRASQGPEGSNGQPVGGHGQPVGGHGQQEGGNG